MENFNNENYGQIDPDFIEQNTFIESSMNSYYDDEMKFDLHNEENNYGVSDPDYIEQNIFIENEFAAIYEEQNHFHYNEDYIDDTIHQTNDFNRNETLRAENIPNEERIVNEDGLITNDEERSDLDDDDNSTGLDYEDEDIEKDGDLDNDEELDDFDAEHYPENHPRE